MKEELKPQRQEVQHLQHFAFVRLVQIWSAKSRGPFFKIPLILTFKNGLHINQKIKEKTFWRMLSSQSTGLRRHWLYPLQTPQKGGILGMTSNYIWWWASSFGNLRIVEYPFISITPKPNLVIYLLTVIWFQVTNNNPW